jgi:anti-anti-sigma factor
MAANTVRCNKSGVKYILIPDFALIGENMASLDEEINACLNRGDFYLAIDFESVPYIDSEGLEKLLEYYNQIRSKAGSLEIFNPNPLCNEILNITCITDFIDIYFNLEKEGGTSYEGRSPN